MKKITLFLLLAVSGIANSQVVSQSTTLAIPTANPILACNSGGTTTPTSSDNRYYRVFNLSTFGITTDYNVTNVQFGVSSLTNPTLPGGFPVTVKIYSTTNTNFPTGFPTGYTQLSSVTTNVLPANVGTLVTVPISATIPVGSRMVVEVGYVAQTAASLNRIFLAANSDGESGPSYIASTACTLPTPVTLTSIGATNAHFVMRVSNETLSISENKLASFAVYPNPSSGLVNFNLPSGVLAQKATLSDITGKQIGVTIENNSIDISRLDKGVYMLNLETSEGNVTKKIIKS